MSKEIKDMITNEYSSAYEGVDSACVVSVIGLDAISTNQFRGKLREKNLRLQVVKNSLARRAFRETPLAPLANGLEGPCALITGGESVIDTAKLLVDLKKQYPAVELKFGVIEGDTELIDLAAMSKMKSRMETLGELAGLLISPAARLAGCLQGPGGRIAGCLKAMADKEDGAAEGGDASSN